MAELLVQTWQEPDVAAVAQAVRKEPVDGRVALGSGHLDESTVTGESAPVRKAAGGISYRRYAMFCAVWRANMPWMKGERLWATGKPTTPYRSGADSAIRRRLDCREIQERLGRSYT